MISSRKIFISCFVSLLIVLSVLSDPKDLIKNLPNYPYYGRQYSGYLELENPNKGLHYIFAESQTDPKNDPLVLWFNGGPGCSSLLAWSQEHGPAIFGTENAIFEINPNSWNKYANVLYIESPAGVGFSYIDSARDNDWYVDDVQAGKENLEALLSFFKKFPQYKQNEFYISGESYAGIYVPYLAYNVLKYNEKQTDAKKIRLNGMLVGNGVTDWKVDTEPALWEFAFTHNIYGPELRKAFLENCADENYEKASCKPVKEKIEILIETINIYDVYRKCYGKKTPTGFTTDVKNVYQYTPWLFNKKYLYNQNYSLFDEQTTPNLDFLTDLAFNSVKPFKDTPPCTDSVGPDTYFNMQEVKDALNLKPSAKDIKWQMCASKIEEHYQPDVNRGSYYLYKDLIGKIRILIYSGTTDAAVPVNGTRRWIKNLNLSVKKPWRYWYSDDLTDISGHVVEYDGLTFVTIRGTGHMVPQWKPAEGLHMLKSFLDKKDL